ncbi:lipoate--protein ligase family protein [Massilibacteroides sp.]|uniref:lipoate--protein ligase family protein n=1 Tax=Massilibacteroides sp. TaxID=2034766 RepID=UPI002625B5D1|nr:lipoate--protein ligase family protein [Massilibacteroides sp.]MDD4514584.1 lipoate--protein ligase family protein [Massilibacteroides sp.]
MLCIDNRTTDVYFNLAAEEYLLKNTQKDVFMLWQNDPCVVIGKHQDIFAEVNIGFVNENKIKIARRYSGGGAVYHDQGNLNFTFIETNKSADFDIFTRKLIDMLAPLGISASTDERRGITIDGLKISGSAQSIYKDRVLFHATLLYSSDLQKLATSLDTPSEQKLKVRKQKTAVKSVKSPVTNVLNHLPSSIGLDEIKNYIINYYTEQTEGNKTDVFKTEDIDRINELRNIKYATESWIYDGKSLKK